MRRAALRISARGNREAPSNFRGRFGGNSRPICPRSSTPRSIFGSSIIFSRIASVVISASTGKNGKQSWRASALHRNRGTPGGFPRVLVHRDFQSQNMIIRDGQRLPDRFPRDAPGAGGIRSRFAPLRSVCEPDTGRSAGSCVEFYCAQTDGVDDPAFAERFQTLRDAAADAGAGRLRFSWAGQREARNSSLISPPRSSR